MKMWKSVRGVVLGLAVAALPCATAGAQQWALYGQGTAGNLRVQDTGYVYGGTMGMYREKQGSSLISWGPDFRFSLLSAGDVSGQYSDRRLDTGLVGLRVAATPHMPIKPYGQAMLGYGYWRGGSGLTRQDRYTGVMQAIVGADYHIGPRLDWRVAEVTYSRMNGQLHYINPITFSTGIVIRVP